MRNVEFHQPVLADAAVDYLITIPEGIYVDCTTGGAGHARLILKKLVPAGRLVCIDADADAIQFAQKQLQAYANVILRQSYFDQLDGIEEANKSL